MSLKLTTYRSGDVVPNLPGIDTFHSTMLFRMYEATAGYAPILIVVTEGTQVRAKLLAVIRRSVRLFPPSIIKRCVTYGTGEYFVVPSDRKPLFAAMLQCLTEEALRQCFLIEFRNLSDPIEGYKAFRDNLYFPINWLRVRNSLHSVTSVEQRFSLSRIRQVKKGLKNGAVVREVRSVEEIRQFANMLHRLYSSNVRRHFPSRDFFLQFAPDMPHNNRGRIFVVLYKDKIIGGSACIYSGTNAYLWFSGGMRKTHAFLYPGVLAVWKALEDAKQRGFAHLEFMDVGLPFRRHGYREFVLRFGGKQFGTRRWFRFRWGWLDRLLTAFYL